MREKIKTVLLIILLVVGIFLATILYNNLLSQYEVENDSEIKDTEIKNEEKIENDIIEEIIEEPEEKAVEEVTNSEDKKIKDIEEKNEVKEESKIELEKETPKKDIEVEEKLEKEETVEEEKVAISDNPTTDFSVTDINGNLVNLSNCFGKPIVVNFWATWCGPCKSELPAFNNMYKKYGEKVIFLMVNLTDGFREKEENVKEFISSNNYEFPIFFDKEYSASNAYSVYSIPMTLFINPDGTLKDTHIGAMSEKTLEKYIKELNGEITPIIKFN